MIPVLFIFFLVFQISLFATHSTLINSLFDSVSLDSSAVFASMIVADAVRNAPAVAGAARNAPAVAVARLLNFQDTYDKFMFHFLLLYELMILRAIKE